MKGIDKLLVVRILTNRLKVLTATSNSKRNGTTFQRKFATGRGGISFDFDKWIIQNGLQSIKDAFIEHDMITPNTMNMVDNTNFASLMSDTRVLQRAD